MQLYTYYRSSAAWRVRLALQLKQLPWTALPVHLLRDGGEQHQPAFRALNPGGTVPLLLTDDGDAISQSLAIIEYLEESHPTPALLPATAAARARVRSLALEIACDIHPLGNLRVVNYLAETCGLPATACDDWRRHWLQRGLHSLETRLASETATGVFCHGDTPGLADCCLVPQLYNARRFQLSLTPFPTLLRIEAACADLPAFVAAHPDAQEDAPPR